MEVAFSNPRAPKLLFKVSSLLIILYALFQLFGGYIGSVLTIVFFPSMANGNWLSQLTDIYYRGYRDPALASPLLVLGLLPVALGLWITWRHPEWIKLANRRYVLGLAAIATTLMLASSMVFAIFAWPRVAGTAAIAMPTILHGPMLTLFGLTFAVSVVAYAALAMELVRSHLVGRWTGFALFVGSLMVNFSWFSLFFTPYTIFENYAPLGSSLYFWLTVVFGAALWQLGNAINREKPVALQWISWRTLRMVAIFVGAIFIAWAVMVSSVFAWDITHMTSRCDGQSQAEQIDSDHSKVTYSSDLFSFSYEISPDLPWAQDNRLVDSAQSSVCGISTWQPPTWTQTRMLSLLPFDLSYVTDRFLPERPPATAQLIVGVTDTEFTSIDEIEDQFERAREFALEQRAKGKNWSVPDYDLSRTSLAGHPAIRQVSTYQQGSYNRLETVSAIVGGKIYSVRWHLNTQSEQDREQFLHDHQTDIQNIIDSVELR